MTNFNAAVSYVKSYSLHISKAPCLVKAEVIDLWCLSCFSPQEKVKAVFDNLIQLEHLNIVKFHKYWADVKENRARVGG